MEKSSFFNSVSGDRKYKAEDWASYFGSFIGNGVFPVPSTGLQVVAGNGMQVTVKAGKAWINGYFYNNTSDLSLTLATADGVLNRIDRIVVRWDLTNRVISVKAKSSSYASSPIAPAVERDADIYELAIADVYVGAGVTAITGSSITDKRLDTTVCGVVAGLVDTIDTTAFNAQLEAWFAEYQRDSAAEYNLLVSYMNSLKLQGDTQYDALEEYFADFKTEAQTDFDTWFEGIQDQLDGDVAGNLLNQINLLKEAPANATAQKTGNVIAITTDVANAKNIYFYAPSDFSETDSYTLNGSALNITDLNGNAILDAWKQGSPVSLIIKDGQGFFKSGGSSGATDTLPPMVSGLYASASNQEINVMWTNPVSESLAGVLVVYKSGGYPERPTDGTKINAGLQETAEITGLTNGTEYFIRLYPYNEKKQYQTLYEGSVVSATPSEGPLQVTSFAVSGSDGSPSLTWVNPTDLTYAQTIIVQKIGSAPTSLTDGTQIYTGTGEATIVTGLQQGNEYYFGAFTVNDAGGTRGAVVITYEIENPNPVTDLAISGAGSSPIITWVNPTDKWYRQTVIIRKAELAPTGLTDGTEVYRGTGQSLTDVGLEAYTPYYYAAFTLNALGGYGLGVTSEAYQYDFPEEPTGWSLIQKITFSQTFTFPEPGWFKIAAVGGGGAGGDGTIQTTGKPIYKGGAGGGSGGISISKIDKISGDQITINITSQSVTIPELGMSASGGENGTSSPGAGGSASGGNLYNQIGVSGTSGESVSSGNADGGTGGTLNFEGESSNGQGGGSYPSYAGSRNPATASNAYVSVYRGNTNIPSATQASAMSLYPKNQSITVKWQDSGDPVQAGSVVVINQDHAPSSPDDGTIYDITKTDSQNKNDNTLTVDGLENNKPTFVAVYPYDSDKNYGVPRSDVEIPKEHTWYDNQVALKNELEEYKQYYTITQAAVIQ